MLDHADSHARRSARWIRLVVNLAVLSILAQTVRAEPAPWPTSGWPTSTPAAQALDGDRLNELAGLIREGEEFPNVHSLLVVRNGYLVLEEYFAGHDADDLHDVQSVTKSFTSAAVGIAVGEGRIAGIDAKVLDFFPDTSGIENLDDRKRAITIENLLTMRSGTDYHEHSPGSPHHQLNALTHGWSEFYLSRPMVSDPGTRFQYDSGGVVLLSAILKARTGRHADALLSDRVFKPLGIEKSWWFKNAEGHPHTGGGLRLRPRDMAKFGLLYLREGRWEDKQVLPRAWVKASLTQHVTFPEKRGPFVGYGYLWWIFEPDPQGNGKERIYAACGFRAQYIFVVPEHKMVVVVTGGTLNQSDMYKPTEFLYSHILPAVGR